MQGVLAAALREYVQVGAGVELRACVRKREMDRESVCV